MELQLIASYLQLRYNMYDGLLRRARAEWRRQHRANRAHTFNILMLYSTLCDSHDNMPEFRMPLTTDEGFDEEDRNVD